MFAYLTLSSKKDPKYLLSSNKTTSFVSKTKRNHQHYFQDSQTILNKPSRI